MKQKKKYKVWYRNEGEYRIRGVEGHYEIVEATSRKEAKLLSEEENPGSRVTVVWSMDKFTYLHTI